MGRTLSLTSSPEELARYKEIYTALEEYRQGTVHIEELLAAMEAEVQEALGWIGGILSGQFASEPPRPTIDDSKGIARRI